MAQQMASFMSPEATENFKKSMGQGMAANAFRRLFPNWDSMGEEQRAEALGKFEGQRSRRDLDTASIRSRAFRDEMKRSM